MKFIVEYFWAIVVVVLIAIGIGFVMKANSEPPEGYAGWSIGEIEKCYSERNNSLECYHLCREHDWKEWYCEELYDNNNKREAVNDVTNALIEANVTSQETYRVIVEPVYYNIRTFDFEINNISTHSVDYHIMINPDVSYFRCKHYLDEVEVHNSVNSVWSGVNSYWGNYLLINVSSGNHTLKVDCNDNSTNEVNLILHSLIEVEDEHFFLNKSNGGT